jgi:hypothetical protein
MASLIFYVYFSVLNIPPMLFRLSIKSLESAFRMKAASLSTTKTKLI